MTIHRPGWKGMAASAAFVAAVAGVTLGVTTLLGITFGSDSSEPAAAVGSGATPLKFCVTGVGVDALVEDEVKPHIEKALGGLSSMAQDALDGVTFAVQRLRQADPIVDTGCSGPPPTPRPFEYNRPIDLVPPKFVSQRGPYTFYIFIMPRPDLDTLLGTSKQRLINFELTCQGDACMPVSWAVFISVEESRDEASLADILADPLGMKR